MLTLEYYLDNLILWPDDQIARAPDPACWIDPLARHLGRDYRVSLLPAASFHGATHQAAIVFQVIVPQQMRDFELQRHCIDFHPQACSWH